MKLHQYCLIFAVSLFTTQLQAQVYKCTFVDAATSRNKVVYTDSPCQQAQKQTLTAIQTKSDLPQQTALSAASLADASALDSAVTRAVLSRDFKLAKSLATSKEHWRLIAIAEGEPAPVLAVASNQAVLSPQAECAQAKYNFDYVSRNSWRDRDLVAAKKSVMYASCGVSEPVPVQNQPIFVGRSFGGLNSGRLFYGNQFPSYPLRHFNHSSHRFGHHDYTNIDRPYANRPNHGRFQQDGVNLRFKSKQFGLQVNSANFGNTSFSNTSASTNVR